MDMNEQTIETNEFYQKWQPIEGSHAHRIVSEYVAALNKHAALKLRADELHQIVSEHNRTLSNADIFTDPSVLGLARLTIEAANDLRTRCEQLEQKEDATVKDRKLMLVRLTNELNAALATVRNAADTWVNTTTPRDRHNVALNAARRNWDSTCNAILGRTVEPDISTQEQAEPAPDRHRERYGRQQIGVLPDKRNLSFLERLGV